MEELPITSDQKVAIVTGSSSGMGFETSLILARNGFYTYATMRKLEGEGSKHLADITKSENLPLQIIRLDVNDDKSVKDAINTIVKEKDRIEVVVNNAGYDLMGALEETSMEEIKGQFETNLFGAIRVLQAVIHHEKTESRYYSEHNFLGRKSIVSAKLRVSCNQICF